MNNSNLFFGIKMRVGIDCCRFSMCRPACMGNPAGGPETPVFYLCLEAGDLACGLINNQTFFFDHCQAGRVIPSILQLF